MVTWMNKEQNLFHNIVGAEIPDWLQGRGSGESGGYLTILDDEGNARTVRPGDVLGPCEHRGFRNLGNAVELSEIKQYSRDKKEKRNDQPV